MGEVDKPADDFRGWAREQWGSLGEQAGKVLTIALDAKKMVRRTITCSSCGVRQQKEIQVGDAKIALDALAWLTDSGFGRAPQQLAGGGGGENMVFVYKLVLPPMGCVNCECEKCHDVEERRELELGPGRWDLHDRSDNSDAVFRTRSDLLAYVQVLDGSPDSE